MERALEIIKKWESLELEAYPDPGSELGQAVAKLGKLMRDYRLVPNWETFDGGPWTIGYGYAQPWVRPGCRISEEWAEHLLNEEISTVARNIDAVVKPDLTQNQLCALISFVYNCGFTAFAKSTLLRKLNGGDLQGAAEEFLKWTKVGGKVLPGLVRRRAEERALFLPH